MYANINCKTKKELKTRVASGEKIGVHQVGPFGGHEPKTGTVTLEGPWYPRPHAWWATARIVDGVIVSVK
jgi:hypothetical protein